MTKLHKLLIAVSLMAAGASAQAATFDLNLNDDAARGQLSGPLANLFSDADGEYQGAILYSDDRNNELLVLSGGALLTGDAGLQDAKLTAGLGLRGQNIDTTSDEGGGGAIGGQFDLRFNGFDRLGFQGYVWYQPKILGLGDIDDQLEWALSADYQILRNASVYVGYRKVTLSPQAGGSYTVDDGPHFGLRLTF